MAVEVHETSYLFLKRAKRPDRQTPRGLQPLSKMPRVGVYSDIPSMVQAPVPWAYNPIHDLESIWWLAVFFTLNKDVVLLSDSGQKLEDGHALYVRTRDGEKLIPAEDAISGANRVAAQAAAMRTLFYHSTKRPSVLRGGLAMLQLRLHPALREAGMLEFLDSIREELVAAYETAEATLSETSPLIGPTPDLYDSIIDALGKAMGNLASLSALVSIEDLARVAALSRNVSRRQVTGDVERAISGFALMKIAEAPDVQPDSTANDTDNAATNVLVEADAPATEDPTPPAAPIPDPPAPKRRQKMQVAPSTRSLRSDEHRAQPPPPPVVVAPPTTHDNTAGAANRPRRTSSRPSGSGSTTQQPATQMAAGPSRDGPSSEAKLKKPAASTRTASRKNPTKSSQEGPGQATTRTKGNGGRGRGRGRGTRGGNKK